MMFTVQDLKKLPPEKVKQVLSELTPQQLEELQYDWSLWGRPEQQEPKGNWKIWLPLAGRGWGKTRCGAEWVRHRIKSGDRRIACVAPTKGDVRRVMVEGESGLLNICWKGDKTYRGAEMGFPVWSPTNNSVTWANGAKAEFFSAEDPERLRGPQFHSAWCFIEGTQVVTDAGEKDVKTLQVGHRVLTSKGFKRILATSQRPSVVGTVKFSNGKELTGTYEHPIWTNRGWVKLGELKEKDIVCAINVLNGTVSGGIATTTDTMSIEEQGLSKEKIETTYTGQNSNTILGKFQKVMMFTTKTVTNLTTIFQTLNSYLGRNTCATTEKSPPSQGQITSQCDTKQTVKTVVRWLKEKLLPKQSSANSVNSKRQTTSVKLLESVRIAEKPLSLFEETSVVNVVSTWEEETEQVVFNIQVEDCPEYFVNGILTHNCDEICAWTRMQETWDMLQFTLRLGKNPRILVTTTPKPVKLLRSIIKPENIASGRVYKTSGSSYENSDNIDLEALSQYEGTRLGRQELYAEILDEAAGALWNRKMIDDAQFDLPEDCIVKDEDGITVDFDTSRKEFAKKLIKVVVSVDPAVTSNEESDMTGIMVAGIDINGNAYILEDATDRYMPEQWAAKAISLYNDYEADLIVAERNQGGDMVRSTLRTVDDTVPIKMVHASRGKYARAEPVSSLYERGKVKHLKYLENLEEQMVTWEPLGSIGSPDRLDAMVWAITNLLLKGYAQAPIKISYGKTINF